MPISSSEIAAMNGGFMSQTMGRNQYASSIGSGQMYGSGGQGDAIMSRGMNTAGAVGSPLMSGAMGMLGLDPMSLGLRAGMGAFGSGAGLGGAAMAGAAVALPAMAAGAAIHHVGSQAFIGAQQQQTMNNVLRQSFAFRNESGGQGFGRGEMSSIGAMTREMSHQFGSGGEVASMGELTSLAGKMGTMGFAQGVRDVKQFGEKFKEMVKTLKTMATDLGTTLEGAMEFAGAAKSGGMFGMNRIQQFTGAARSATVSGGLAMSEVTSAASIGGQISRSIGGLGRQGMMAGIKTIGQIGTAQQMGVINEEDIFNATGQSGAEGRQAFASSQMQRAGSWLQSGRGRRMLASLAEKDGTLNEGNVNQLLQGGMSIGETMKLDHQQLGKVGRANFIRNEGRLRGAAMEKLGAFLPAMQLQEWAQSKGIDINNMDDRSMLFAQRQLGMGRDEMDTAMKMVNNMPQIIEHQRRSEQDDGYFQKLASSRKQRGVEGAKNRFEQAKETINGKLQKMGQDIFNEGSEQIDQFIAKLTGAYVETYSKDVDDNYRSLRGGGAGGRAFGVGSGRVGAAASQFSRGGALGGGGGPGLFAQMSTGSNENMGDALLGKYSRKSGAQGGVEDVLGISGLRYIGGAASWLMSGQSDMSKLKEAGFNMSGVNSNQTAAAKLQSIQAMQRAAATGYNDAEVKMGAANDWIKKAYARDEVTGSAEQRMDSFGTALNAHGTDEAKAAWAKAKTPEQKAALMANLERGQGITTGGIHGKLGLPDSLRGIETGKFTSTSEENKAYAGAIGGAKKSAGEKLLAGSIEYGIQGVLAAGAFVTGGGSAAMGFAARQTIHDQATGFSSRLSGSGEKEQAMGAYLKGAEGRDMMSGLLTGSNESRKAAREQLSLDLANGKADDPLREVKQKMLDGGSYYESVVANHGKPLSEGQKKAWEKDNPGRSAADAEQSLGAQARILTAVQNRDLARAARGATVRANKDSDKLAALGVYNAATGGLTAAKATELTKMGAGALAYARAGLQQNKLEMGLGGTEGTAEGDRGIMDSVHMLGDENSARLAGMSVKQKRALAQSLGGEMGAGAGESAALHARLSGRGGVTGGANTILGAGFSKSQLKGMDLTGAGAAGLLAGAGIDTKTTSGADLVKTLQEGAAGGKGTLAEALKKITHSADFDEGKKKKAMDSAENADPLQAAIKKNGEQANDLLKKLVTYSGKTADEISKLQVKDAEAVKK